MKNYHQLLAYIIKGIALVSLPVLAINSVVAPQEAQARLEYSNFKKLISAFEIKLKDSDSSEQTVLTRKTELLSLLRNLQDYLDKLIVSHALPSREHIGIALTVYETLEVQHTSYSNVSIQYFDSKAFTKALSDASHVLNRISEWFPFVTEENSSTD